MFDFTVPGETRTTTPWIAQAISGFIDHTVNRLGVRLIPSVRGLMETYAPVVVGLHQLRVRMGGSVIILVRAEFSTARRNHRLQSSLRSPAFGKPQSLSEKMMT